MKKALLFLIRFYQVVLSPRIAEFLEKPQPTCRFYPSCSEYLVQAIDKNGVFKGLGQGLSRIARCHPWHRGGYDPLP